MDLKIDHPGARNMRINQTTSIKRSLQAAIFFVSVIHVNMLAFGSVPMVAGLYGLSMQVLYLRLLELQKIDLRSKRCCLTLGVYFTNTFIVDIFTLSAQYLEIFTLIIF
jgi:hypothetical protein